MSAKNSTTPWSTAYEFAAISGAACAVLGLGLGMLKDKPGIGAVLGAGVGLAIRAAAIAGRSRLDR